AVAVVSVKLEKNGAKFNKRGGQEEVGPAVLRVEEGTHVPVSHDRGQLEETPAEHHLDPAKRGTQIIPLDAQGPSHRVHDIGPDHGNFVNDEGLQFLKKFRVLTSAEALRVNNGRRQLEKGMNRLAADVERGDPGGSQHDRGFRCLLPQVVQEGRFPCPGLAREKNTLALALNEVQGMSKLVRQRDLREIRRSVRHAMERGRNDARVGSWLCTIFGGMHSSIDK